MKKLIPILCIAIALVSCKKNDEPPDVVGYRDISITADHFQVGHEITFSSGVLGPQDGVSYVWKLDGPDGSLTMPDHDDKVTWTPSIPGGYTISVHIAVAGYGSGEKFKYFTVQP